ncbi:nitrous oxide reductase accessory protein NosL [Brevibacillus ginsengisoli]|uniref:nitrous oxide reductase accessory protein NosL n=1 Tax=Brevibacillus ginsengisoli TaxID=363854 RepID=UPI003CE9DB3E
MKKGLVVFATIMMLGLTGCGKQAAAPVDINEEADKCQECNMQVANNSSATEMILKNGQVYKFDDIGCMNEWKKQHASEEVDVMYVRDYYSNQWLKEEEATYAYDPTFPTPMAYGIYSFKDSQEAQKFVDEQKKGKIMTAADLEKHMWDRNKDSMGNMNMNNNNMNMGQQPANHSSHK